MHAYAVFQLKEGVGYFFCAGHFAGPFEPLEPFFFFFLIFQSNFNPLDSCHADLAGAP